jgi:FkbM family methyltransferase
MILTMLLLKVLSSGQRHGRACRSVPDLPGGKVSARAALEQMTHRFALRRRLPAPFDAARIYMSSEGGLKYLRPRLGSIDPTLLRLVTEVVRPADVVWDIGANLGLFSFAAAVAAGPRGRVLAIEPDTLLVGLLRRSIAANRGQAPVDVLPVAISDSLGVSRLQIARRNRATSHLEGFGNAQTGGVRATELVPTVTLDWLAERFPVPNVIKIDVEAAEIKVLTGSESVLRSYPKIICEVSSCNSQATADLLVHHGYSVYDGELLAAQRTPVATAPWTTLAIHERCI